MNNPDDRYLAQVKRIVLDHLYGRPVTVYLFGSRARGDARTASDIDIAIDSAEPLPPALVPAIADALEQSTVPYRVDVVDLTTAGSALRQRVKQEGVQWTD
ncbi:MAG: nucleotidyltransferase domain-containing protein [Hyphomicrobiales bacterium]|nr:nucleotidyltransferase domain-containing protein [Hyphomicrobiales bacterium]